MAHPILRLVAGLLVVGLFATHLGAQSGSRPPGLTIVVIEGEDAVNILQQKTAVAPVVEVRDRNNLPVAGVTVTFSVSGGQATFAGGAQTLSVTTNAAGRAAAAALNPVQAGAVRIDVLASWQGQTVTTSITQTNVATAAEAARAAQAARQSGSAGSGGGSGAGASAGTATAGVAASAAGGGLSGAAIAGIVGGVAAGAGLGLKAASGGGDEGGDSVSSNGGGGGGANAACRFTLSQTSVSVSSGPATVAVRVTVEPAGCSNATWTATASSPSNFFLLSNSSNTTTATGSGEFSVNAPANTTGAQRTGTVTISPAGLTVPVTQAANCTFNVSPTSFGTIQSIGGTQQVAVSLANSPCDPQTWTAFVNTVGAVTITPTSGTGSGLVSVTFVPQAPNTSGSRPVSITVAGQLISGTQLATTSAAACQPQAIRGADVGESRTIEMGRTSGPFLLKYDTGDRSDDRVVVWYEGRPLFDSGCVSTGGPQTRSLAFSGQSSAIAVQVAPNCRGGWGSAWSVEVACPQ